MDWSAYRKVFVPTLEVFYNSGDEAIRSFSDNYSKKQQGAAGEKHAVVVTLRDIATLGNVARSESPNAPGAKEALLYIERSVKDNAGVVKNEPLHLGDNLHLILADSPDLQKLGSTKVGSKTTLKNTLEVICQHSDEVILHRMEGFNASTVLFDKVNPNIRKEGIKYIADNALYAELMGYSRHSGQRIDPNMFKDHITDIYPNQYIAINTEGGKPGAEIVGQMIGHIKEAQYGRFTMGPLEFKLITQDELKSQRLFNIEPRDLGQRLYVHALRQPHITRIFVTGEAACGKTLIGYGATLLQTLQRVRDGAADAKIDTKRVSGRFKSIYITKTNDTIGGQERKRGFLPGDEQEKLNADVQSYYDAHGELGINVSMKDLAFGWGVGEGDSMRKINGGPYVAPREGGVVKIQDYAMWRGRTISNSVIFLDEAQNLHPMEFKHLNQRVGLGGLVIVSGDYDHQIDNPKMTATSNGLFQGLRHFLGQPYVAVISLEGSYRDEGAEHAGKMKAYR